MWFLPGALVSYTDKTDCHEIDEILLKAALKAIALNQIQCTSNATTITHHEGV
jgi:hypothetical protein